MKTSRLLWAAALFSLPFTGAFAETFLQHFEDFEAKVGDMEKKLLDIGCVKSDKEKTADEMNEDVKAGKCGWSVLPLQGSDGKKLEKLTIWGAVPAFMDFAPSATTYYFESELAAADMGMIADKAEKSGKAFDDALAKTNKYYGNPTKKHIESIEAAGEDGQKTTGSCGRLEWKMVKPKAAPLFSHVERRDVYLESPCAKPDDKNAKFTLRQQIRTPLGEKQLERLVTFMPPL